MNRIPKDKTQKRDFGRPYVWNSYVAHLLFHFHKDNLRHLPRLERERKANSGTCQPPGFDEEVKSLVTAWRVKNSSEIDSPGASKGPEKSRKR